MSLDATLDALVASLAAALPARHVQRDLPADPMNLPREQLLAGVVCLVCKGGGNFSNTYGREAQQGRMDGTLVAFLQVEETGSSPKDVEAAELQLLDEIRAWCASGPFDPADDVLPIDWQQSEQLEYPYGWLLVRLEIKFP